MSRTFNGPRFALVHNITGRLVGAPLVEKRWSQSRFECQIIIRNACLCSAARQPKLNIDAAIMEDFVLVSLFGFMSINNIIIPRHPHHCTHSSDMTIIFILDWTRPPSSKAPAVIERRRHNNVWRGVMQKTQPNNSNNNHHNNEWNNVCSYNENPHDMPSHTHDKIDQR